MHKWFPILLFGLSCSTTSEIKTAWDYPSPPIKQPQPIATRAPAQVQTIRHQTISQKPSPAALKHVDSPLYLDWPLESQQVTSFYGPRTDPIHSRESFHNGVDISAPYGALIKAPAKGYVKRAQWNNGHGRQIILRHSRGFETVYSHLSAFFVSKSQSIERGQVIGLVGNSGKSTGSHLHLEVLHRGNHRDPLSCFGIQLFEK